MDWFTIALISMLVYGFQNFAYKVVAEKNLDSTSVLKYSFITGAAIALIQSLKTPTSPESLTTLTIFAIIQATFYIASRYAKIESFKNIPAIIALPVSRTHFALTALLAIIFLHEPLTTNKSIGILLFLSVVILISNGNSTEKEKKPSNFRRGITLAIATAILTTISEFMVKLAATGYSQSIFMLISYVWLTILSTAISQNSPKKHANASEINHGIAIGTLNYLSFYTAISALETGPASVVFPIIGLNMLVTIMLSVIIYKERLTLRRIAAIILSIISIIMLGR